MYVDIHAIFLQKKKHSSLQPRLLKSTKSMQTLVKHSALKTLLKILRSSTERRRKHFASELIQDIVV